MLIIFNTELSDESEKNIIHVKWLGKKKKKITYINMYVCVCVCVLLFFVVLFTSENDYFTLIF